MKQNKGKRILKGQGINIRFRAIVLKVGPLDKQQQLQLPLRIWETAQILTPPETYWTQKIWEWNPTVCFHKPSR